MRAHPGCGRTLAGPAHHRLAPMGSGLGLDLFFVGTWLKLGGWMVLCLVLWYRICIMLSLLCILIIFHLYSCICPAKHAFFNTSGTRSIVYAYVSKVCLFLMFWIIIGSRMLSLVTANKPTTLPFSIRIIEAATSLCGGDFCRHGPE